MTEILDHEIWQFLYIYLALQSHLDILVQMGKLQSLPQKDVDQFRTNEEADRMFGVHPRS